METYKIGNKVKCIIRAYSSGYIGDEYMEYDNQPYTVLKEVEASLTFNNINSEGENDLRQFSYNVDSISDVRISNVFLTPKILNLIFLKNEDKLCNTCKDYDTNSEGKIFLDFPAEEVYQMFIYDNNSQLVRAEGTFSGETLEGLNPNENYLIFYTYIGDKSYSLNKQSNVYVKLDLEVIGNTDDHTTKNWIHLDKCAVSVDKSMYFNGSVNTVNLVFKVLDSKNKDYITLG